MWFVMFYLNQIGIHDNQLMLLPQNWYSTGYIAMYIHCTILQKNSFNGAEKFIQWCKHVVYLKDIWKRNILPFKSNSVISWKQVTNCLTYFATIKIAEENLIWNIHYICLTLSFKLWRRKRKENRAMCSVLWCRMVQWIYIAILYIQYCTSSVATASAECHVCWFGSDSTQKITFSVVVNFLGGNIFVQVNEWISCNTIVLVLFPLVNMLMKQAMSTSRYHIRSKDRQKQYWNTW